jgi:hypothetical protein
MISQEVVIYRQIGALGTIGSVLSLLGINWEFIFSRGYYRIPWGDKWITANFSYTKNRGEDVYDIRGDEEIVDAFIFAVGFTTLD